MQISTGLPRPYICITRNHNKGCVSTPACCAFASPCQALRTLAGDHTSKRPAHCAVCFALCLKPKNHQLAVHSSPTEGVHFSAFSLMLCQQHWLTGGIVQNETALGVCLTIFMPPLWKADRTNQHIYHVQMTSLCQPSPHPLPPLPSHGDWTRIILLPHTPSPTQTSTLTVSLTPAVVSLLVGHHTH